MIYVEMYGRLGNQLFRYVVARVLQMKYYPDETICISFNQIYKRETKDPTWKNELKHLKDYYIEYHKPGKVIFNESEIRQKLLCGIYYLGLRRYTENDIKSEVEYTNKFYPELNRMGVYWFRQGHFHLGYSKCRNKFVSGAFEDPRYFNEYRELLLHELLPDRTVSEKNRELFRHIVEDESVCVSIRRGDFFDSKHKSLHAVCDKNYFEKSIETVCRKLRNPKFVFFSDDIQWVKENIKIQEKCLFETGNDDAWEKLKLMSACKHFILSNSTFSWWAQWLSLNDDKIVIAPQKWFHSDFESGLIDPDWILVKTF